MQESANIALSYLMANAQRYGIDESFFATSAIHVHVPAGATPKDGPSAGITIATAILSLALGKQLKRKCAMTGELTLTGKVYPVGGIREKLLAVKRQGIRQVLLPKANEPDFLKVPAHVRKGIEVHFVDHYDQVAELTLNA